MRHKIKQVIAIGLIALICMISLPVLAAEPLDQEKDCTLTLNYQYEGKPISGSEFDIYCVASRSDYSIFTLTEEFSKYPIDMTDIETQDDWDRLVTTLKGFIKRDKIKPMTSGRTGKDGKVQFQQPFKPGLYLVIGHNVKLGDYLYIPYSYMLALPQVDQAKNCWDYVVESQVKGTIDDFPPGGGGGGGGGGGSTYDSCKVLKVWNDIGNEESRPKEIEVQLLCNEDVYDTVILSAENNWRYTWNKLPKGQDWIVVEKEVGAYAVSVTQAGTTFTIKNSYIPPVPPDNPPANPPDNPPTNPPDNPIEQPPAPKLPQTGLLWWPVPILLFTGALSILIGLRINREVSHE